MSSHEDAQPRQEEDTLPRQEESMTQPEEETQVMKPLSLDESFAKIFPDKADASSQALAPPAIPTSWDTVCMRTPSLERGILKYAETKKCLLIL